MKVKYTNLAVWATFLVLVMNSASGAVNTREIEKVRNKGVLDGTDLLIIDNFVAEAVRELVKTEDFTSIAKTRSVILARASSRKDSAQAQYTEQFSQSAHKYISLGFKQTDMLMPQERKFKAALNLLILVNSLENLRLADLAIEMLNDKNKAIRYWAVHSITNSGIVEQLNAPKADNLKLALNIVGQLKELVEEAGPEIIALMAKFAAGLNIPQSEDLLLQIADMRISRYADWTVEYELLDATILKLLYSRMSSAGSSRPAVARRFGQLYSYAIQRYVKGQDFLSAARKHQLASVLVETEKTCIGKLLEMPQSVIKKAVEQDDYPALLLEHSRLLGDETRPGRLALKLNFDYGTKLDGSKRTAPLTLPQPTKTTSR